LIGLLDARSSHARVVGQFALADATARCQAFALIRATFRYSRSATMRQRLRLLSNAKANAKGKNAKQRDSLQIHDYSPKGFELIRNVVRGEIVVRTGVVAYK
jgi:hypothetical protein